ncbi:hypothetical protein AGLY_002950, partial [Aphis glycines]
CMHCNKKSIFKPVYKCTGCSKVSHQTCLERNQYINECPRLEKRKVKNQKTQLKIKYNELGELPEPNYLNNMLVTDKRQPLSLMSEKYLKSRHTEHKSLFFSIQKRILEPYTTASISRRSGQGSSTLSAVVPEQDQGIYAVLSTEEISTLVPPPEGLEEQEQSSETPEPIARSPELGVRTPESDAMALELNTEVPEQNAVAPEPNAVAPEPNALATEPNADKSEFSKTVSELNVKKL